MDISNTQTLRPVRAKFVVGSITPTELNVWNDEIKRSEPITAQRVTLYAVTSQDNSDAENALFTKSTPTGTLDMTVTNEEAVKQLVPGQAYYLDITPVSNHSSVSDSSSTESGSGSSTGEAII